MPSPPGGLWDRVKNTALLDAVAARLSVPLRAAGPITAPHGETVAASHLTLLGPRRGRPCAGAGGAADLVSAASFEPFGLAVLEAAQAGCALVLSDIATFRELWDGAALFVDGWSPAAWADAVETLNADPDHRTRLGAAARERAPATPPPPPPRRCGLYGRIACAGGGRRIVYFTHSLQSCWNHGNAHFLRGVLRELIARGHDGRGVRAAGNWSLANLIEMRARPGWSRFAGCIPELSSTSVAPDAALEPLVDGAHLVIVHEWNDHALVAALGRACAPGAAPSACCSTTLIIARSARRRRCAPTTCQAMTACWRSARRCARSIAAGAGRAASGTWHEAADTRLFHPPAEEGERAGLVWVATGATASATAELERFLFAPAAAAGWRSDIYGVRYPGRSAGDAGRARRALSRLAPNARAPAIFARHLATVHVPRRYYATILPGIPTIRVFEALACGSRLVSAPWDDAEHLFRPARIIWSPPTARR